MFSIEMSIGIAILAVCALLGVCFLAVGTLLSMRHYVQRFLDKLYSKTGFEAVCFLNDRIEYLIMKGRFPEAKEILLNMDMRRLDPMVILAVIDLAYAFWDELPYEALLIKARMGILNSQDVPLVKKALKHMEQLVPRAKK